MKIKILSKPLSVILIVALLLTSSEPFTYLAWGGGIVAGEAGAAVSSIPGSALAAVGQAVGYALHTGFNSPNPSLTLPKSILIPTSGPTISIQDVDPKIRAFLDRTHEVRAVPDFVQPHQAVAAKPIQSDSSSLPVAEPFQILASLHKALDRFETAEDIKKAPIEVLDDVARKLWENAPNTQASFETQGWESSVLTSQGDGSSSIPPSRRTPQRLQKPSKSTGPQPKTSIPPPPGLEKVDTGKDNSSAEKRYVRKNISTARFGDGDRRRWLAEAYRLQDRINKVIVGQDVAAKVLQDRLVQYLENLGTRTKDPIAMHMIGLPGIGKSAMLDQLDALGLPTLRIDAQRYIHPQYNLAEDLRSSLSEFFNDQKNKGRPLIVILEEIDKLPEKGSKKEALGVVGLETTNSMIGTLNQILTDGKLPDTRPNRPPLDLSNVFFVTTMNFSPTEIERFSKEALQQEKVFYDFTIEDFAKFDQWIRTESSAKYKVLSRLFRSNTVSRMAPNAIILKPLSRDDYKGIARQIVDIAVHRNTMNANGGKRLEVQYTERFLDFLVKVTAYAPAGARETVHRADALTEQLINYGTKATIAGDHSLDRPRKIVLDFDPESNSAVVQVASKVLNGKRWSYGQPFNFAVRYDANVGALVQPANISVEPPASPASPASKDRPLTKKQIIEARFPKTQSAAKGLAHQIDQDLIGQQEFTKLVEREMNVYLGRMGPAKKEPSTLVLAGFPGIGKTELVNLSARHLDLPIIRINMQAFSSDASTVVEDLLDTIEAAIEKAKNQKNWHGKYIILLEELDKVYEIEPDGKLKNRPVMAMVKDLLNNGQASITTKTNWSTNTRKIDIRDSFLFVTMNFAVDRFGFKADPRMTSIRDTREAWKRLKTRLTDMKRIMGAMFLPETVSRLMSRLYIMAPLEEQDYKKVIDLQGQDVIAERLHDKDGKNVGMIDVKLTPAYKQYLFSETVVPSEGPRHTSVSSRIKISADLESALKNLKRSSAYANKPIIVILDYKPGSSQVVGSVVLRDSSKGKPIEVFRQKVPLFFPPLKARGQMKESRIRVAAHEFGHAYLGVRLGLRFEYATAVQPMDGVGGYVKFNDKSQSAKSMLASIYTGVASRAMERIFLSKDPLNNNSVLDITWGPSMDIKGATMELYNMLYELGFDPSGGTLDRLGVIGAHKYADFESLPSDVVERLGRILREMENYVVKDFIEANPREWYIDKITRFARAGGMTEEEFYKMLAYKYPGASLQEDQETVNIGESSLLQDYFKGAIKRVPGQARIAREFKQGQKGTTPLENVEAFTKRFIEILGAQPNLRGKSAQVDGAGPSRSLNRTIPKRGTQDPAFKSSVTGRDSTTLASAHNNLQQLIDEDPLGRLNRQMTTPTSDKAMAELLAKYAHVIKAIRTLKPEQQSKLNADSPKNARASAKMLRIPVREFLSYYRDAMQIKAMHGQELNLDEVKEEGKRLLEQSKIRRIDGPKLPSVAQGSPFIVLYSGEKCTWCDMVRPTIARLSDFFKATDFYYSDSQVIKEQEHIRAVPQFIGYFQDAKIHAVAYADTTKELWDLMNFVAAIGPNYVGEGVVKRINGNFKIFPAKSPEEVDQLLFDK